MSLSGHSAFSLSFSRIDVSSVSFHRFIVHALNFAFDVINLSCRLCVLITITRSFYKQRMEIRQWPANECAKGRRVTKNYKPVTPRGWDAPLIRQSVRPLRPRNGRTDGRNAEGENGEGADEQKDERKVIKNVRGTRKERTVLRKGKGRSPGRRASHGGARPLRPRPRPRPMDAGPFRAVTINHK